MKLRLPKRIDDMAGKNALALALAVLIAASFVISGCQLFSSEKIKVLEIKMAAAINENLAPVKPADSFPSGTSSVYCCFKWENAEINSQIIAQWHYTSENINILNYSFNIPRRDGSGSVVLSMPEGKTLPSGSYRIDLILNNRTLKSREFRIE